MEQVEETGTFEQVLLAHATMCYSVALAFTHDPYGARDLTQDVMTWAWRNRETGDGTKSIKTKLLTALRERFLQRKRSRSSMAPIKA